MMNVCCNRETPDRIALETTKWLEYIKTLLTAAIKMSRLLVEVISSFQSYEIQIQNHLRERERERERKDFWHEKEI
jgi:hypothetical protein